MVLSEAISDFRAYARAEPGHTSSPCYCYTSWQNNFARWLADQGLPDPPIQQIPANLVRRYSHHLTGKNDRPRTIRGALHASRSLFDSLTRNGAVPTNPAREVRLPKKDAATRLLVTDEDLLALLEAADRQASDCRCVRDRAVLSALIFCGLRRHEFLDLRIGSVNLADQSLLVQQGKGQ